MTLGRTASNAIKIKTDGGLRAVQCACCEEGGDCQCVGLNGFNLGFIEVTAEDFDLFIRANNFGGTYTMSFSFRENDDQGLGEVRCSTGGGQSGIWTGGCGWSQVSVLLDDECQSGFAVNLYMCQLDDVYVLYYQGLGFCYYIGDGGCQSSGFHMPIPINSPMIEVGHFLLNLPSQIYSLPIFGFPTIAVAASASCDFFANNTPQ